MSEKTPTDPDTANTEPDIHFSRFKDHKKREKHTQPLNQYTVVSEAIAVFPVGRV